MSSEPENYQPEFKAGMRLCDIVTTVPCDVIRQRLAEDTGTNLLTNLKESFN